MKEKLLLRHIKKGNTDALEQLVRELYPSIYIFVSAKVRGDDIAKDITQEVFLRLIKQLPTYHNEGKLLHYLYRIASNLCVDEFRKRGYRQHADSDELAYCLASDVNVHEEILQRISEEELLYYVGKLSSPQQDVILLRYYQQLTFKEIADTFGLPVSSVKSRHRAALDMLYQMMKGDGYHE